VPVAEELVQRNRWLIRIRWLGAIGTVAAIEIAAALSGGVPRGPLYALTAGLVLYNAILWLITRRPRHSPANLTSRWRAPLARLIVPRTFHGLGREAEIYGAAFFAMAQITIDLFFLAMLLHYAGGIENPFIYFFIFHVIIASILLSQRATWLQATIGFVLISAVAIGECLGWIPHHHLVGLRSSEGALDPLFVATRLGALGITVSLSVYMCSNVAVTLRRRERDIVLLTRTLVDRARELETAYRAVTESELAKSRYLRKVAHELQGPLGTVQTTLSVLLSGMVGELPQATRELAERCRRRTEELTLVTRDLLSLSRAREGRLTVQREDVRLDRLVQDVVAELEPTAAEQGVALRLEAPPVAELKAADPLGLRQLAQNLISNAIRYTPRGGRVSVRLSRNEQALRLEVEDTGIGIPVEDVEHIFDEFYRSGNARDFASQGTGLGLPIVKAIVEEHDGTISVTSRLGEGSCFTVDLPVRAC
jgi:signal transduction histidine kinase